MEYDLRRRPKRRKLSRTILVLPPAITRSLEELEQAKANGQVLEQYPWVYGIPLVTDPRDFTPDPRYCTPNQIEHWTKAVQLWDAGRPVRFPTTLDNRWGIGISLLRHHDEEYPDPSREWKN